MTHAALNGARLYLCTDARREQGDLPEFLDAVLSGGVDIVQLRDKGLEARQELEFLEVFAEACRRHGRLLAVNDRADVAHAARAAWGPRPEVLHLGQDDLPVAAARAVLGPEVLIGRSCHAESEVDAALVEPGVDYFCTGPVWPTPTKPGRHAPGLGLVSYAAGRTAERTAERAAERTAGTDPAAARPWFAIGGIDQGNLEQVLDAGARRIVVVRALTAAADPHAAAAELSRRVREREL
ncbi:thiamine phosphate synthase [Streptacidiphilus sp. 4-A2]|nr:thiamine phosphate synthase [Streptacidiphilus sp. 4-A2]